MGKTGKFEVKQITKFQDLVDGKVTELGESDLCFQSGTDIIQLKYQDGDDERKVQIKPGFYTFALLCSRLRKVIFH